MLAELKSEGDRRVRAYACRAAGDPEAVRHLAWFALVCGLRSWCRTSGSRSSTCSTTSSTSRTSPPRSPWSSTYVRVEQVDVTQILRRRWRWSLAVGVVLAALLVFNVYNTRTRPRGPHGAYFVFELLWRGVGYGLVDTLLLTIFPSFVALRDPARSGRRSEGEAAIHGADAPRWCSSSPRPTTGATRSTARTGSAGPRRATSSSRSRRSRPRTPSGRCVAHVSQHVAAVTHAYESRIFNPPATKS